MSQTTKIEISTWSLVKIILVVLAVWFLYLVRDIVAILFVAVVLAAALEPLVVWLVKRKIPRFVSTLSIYVVFLAVVSLVLILLVPPTINQIQNLVVDFPTYWSHAMVSFSGSATGGLPSYIQDLLTQLQPLLSAGGQGLISTLENIFGGIFSFVVILVIAFYLLLEENATNRILRLVAPSSYQPYLTRILFRMQDKIGLWLRGQLTLSLIIASIVYVGMRVFGAFYPGFGKYSLVLALIAFLLEFIPYLGPILAAIPAVFLGLTYSMTVVGLMVIFYFCVHWLENNILIPKVMQRAVGLNPIIIIIALMIGATIGGIIGVILAVPVATALSVVSEEIFKALDQREN